MQRAAPLGFGFETKPRSSSLHFRLLGRHALVQEPRLLLAVKSRAAPPCPPHGVGMRLHQEARGKVLSNEEEHTQGPTIL